MSQIYVVWSENADKAQARMQQITAGEEFRVLRRGDFERIQAEDGDVEKSLKSGGQRYCIVFEVT